MTAPSTFTLEPGPLPKVAVLGVALAVGMAAALGLASLMYMLVHSSEMRLAESTAMQMLDFVRVKRNETSERKDRKPERPQLSQAPEAPPTADSSADAGQQLAVSMPQPTGNSNLAIDTGAGLGSGSGDYLPIVKVAPIYPRRALERGIEGSCLVRYTVTTAGTVRDVEVDEAGCPEQIFHRPAIEAAKRFRYKPRVANGVPIEVRGVRNVFYFERETDAEAAEER